MSRSMPGVILAAGTGTRFNGAVQPKCLGTFEDRTLINLRLYAMRECGITTFRLSSALPPTAYGSRVGPT